MGFYDDDKTAEQYISMAEGYDGRELIEILRKTLEAGSSVLEIGLGPGIDFKILEHYYKVTGSDNSQYFLDRFRASNKVADLLKLDAVTLETSRKFNCIYSNKVLHHLSLDELERSLEKQRGLLLGDGIVFHSFWKGTGVEEHHGLKFVNQTEDSLRRIFANNFKILEIAEYTEMENSDSIYVLATI